MGGDGVPEDEGGGEPEDGVDDGGVEGLGPYDPGGGIGWLPEEGGVEGLGPYDPGDGIGWLPEEGGVEGLGP